MSIHSSRKASIGSTEENLVAFPQLNRSTGSLGHLSQASKLSNKNSNNNENGAAEEPRIPNVHSVQSLSSQIENPQQQQAYDPDDASAGTWGSDSSDYSSSFDDDDDNFEAGLNDAGATQQQKAGPIEEQSSPWPVYAGLPPSTDSRKGTTSSSGCDGANEPTACKFLPKSNIVASLNSKASSVHETSSFHERTSQQGSVLDSSRRASMDSKSSIGHKQNWRQPQNSGSQPRQQHHQTAGGLTQDAIVEAQKRFFATIGGPGALGGILRAMDVPNSNMVQPENEEDVDSVHGIDPDSVYRSNRIHKVKLMDSDQGIPKTIPTKKSELPSDDKNEEKGSVDTVYFSADDGVDPFDKTDQVSKQQAANELGMTTHAIVSRADLEVDSSSFEGNSSFGNDGDDGDNDDSDYGVESSALHVEFSPARELRHQSTDSVDTGDDDPQATAFQKNPEVQSLAQNFAMEHRIFLRSILELLGQRDKYATEVGMNDPHTIKSGPLKKASHLIKGIWKVKYVEIRRGMFSYYEDALSNTSTHQGELLRKNIPLEANMCTCRAVKLHHKALNLAPGGAIFELTVNQGPKRLWMANSREERGAWINAIHDAMVGGSVARGDTRGKTNGSSTKHCFQHDVKKYMKTLNLAKHAKSKPEYVRALRDLRGSSLYIPIHWLMEQVESEHTGFQEEAISSGVDQLWKDLIRDSVRINGEMFVGKSGHAPERIVGALMRSIINCNRKAVAESKITGAAASKYHLTESQALAYARDVLLSGNRTRSGGDSYYCVDTLCSSPGLVVTVPNSYQAEPVSVTVSKHIDDLSTFYSVHDKSGWLRTRTRWAKRWKKRYFVLSEGTLSFYEKAFPRPHGLQGQIVLVDATIFVKKNDENANGVRKRQFIVTIVANDVVTLKERERQLLFENEEKFVVWSSTLEGALKNKLGDESNPSPNAVKNVLRRLGHVRDDGQSIYGYSLAEKSLKDHATCLGLDIEAIERQLALYARTSCATVKVSVEASTEYKICTTDPQGDELEDTWATIRTVYLQDFQLSGGPSGRFIRGEEIVQIDIVDCPGEEPPPIMTPPAPPSPRTSLMSISKGRRLFRHLAGDDYELLDE